MAQHKRVNTEYLRLLKEGVLLWRLALAPRPQAAPAPRTVLLVVPCLIGEFAAALPAIADFISRHPDTRIDLMVAPPLVPLAQRIKGAGAVYAVRSVYEREEGASRAEPLPERYDRIIAMRMSKDAYRVVRTLQGALQTSAWPITRYALHLAASMLMRRTPRQWQEFNFELLGGEPRMMSFDLLLSIEPAIYEKLGAHMKTGAKQVIVHTGASWPMKHWPRERWIELLKTLHARGAYHFLFVGGGAIDEADYKAIAPALDFATRSLIGQISVLETVALMRLAHGFVGVDSGPANLARLAELPSLTLYGPGPHMYLPHHPRDVALDKSHGRGLFEMYVASERGFIHQISATEAADAFGRLILKP